MMSIPRMHLADAMSLLKRQSSIWVVIEDYGPPIEITRIWETNPSEDADLCTVMVTRADRPDDDPSRHVGFQLVSLLSVSDVAI